MMFNKIQPSIMPQSTNVLVDKPLYSVGLINMKEIEEIWKDILGYEGIYQLSNLGKVKALELWKSHGGSGILLHKEKVLKTGKYKKGYEHVNLCKNAITDKKVIHRLVAEYFIPNPDNKPCVNHIDGNPANSRVDNLEWCTYRENVDHARRTGLMNDYGERSVNAKLTKEAIKEIRKKQLSGRELAKKFKVSPSLICGIINGKRWKHV